MRHCTSSGFLPSYFRCNIKASMIPELLSGRKRTANLNTSISREIAYSQHRHRPRFYLQHPATASASIFTRPAARTPPGEIDVHCRSIPPAERRRRAASRLSRRRCLATRKAAEFGSSSRLRRPAQPQESWRPAAALRRHPHRASPTTSKRPGAGVAEK